MPSERLKTVLAIGDTLALFPVLKDWPTEELQALLKDVGEYAAVLDKQIDEEWKAAAFNRVIFLDRNASRNIDRIRDDKKRDTLIVMSEICSVVIYYLEERGIEIGDEGA